ncbi:hypothetical protein DITRI_Ditri06bG0122000 [Diplodiscus trichospermus]
MIVETVIFIVGSILVILAEKSAEYMVDPIARQVTYLLVDPIARRLTYLFEHKSKFQSLRDRLQELHDARKRMQKLVDESNRKGEGIFSDAKQLLIKVNGKISEEAGAQLEKDEKKANQRCFFGLCPNFMSLYQLSRKAEKEANAITELLKQSKDWFEKFYRHSPEETTTRTIKKYTDFRSRTAAFDVVTKVLKDLSMIDVCGMGRVGKTTIVKQVATQAKKENLSDKVLMEAITQSFGTSKIQDQIAVEFDLTFHKQSESGRAAEPCGKRTTRWNIRVILDDIWKELNMQDLGIPYGDEHTGNKILLTSRNDNVLSQMGSQKNLPIDVLKEEEAWNLFRKMASNIVLKSELISTAIDICKECGVSPIAIVTVGKAMRNKKKVEKWEDALLQLRRLSERTFDGISAPAYSAIELSYKFLGVEHQLTFLLCGRMGRDPAIKDLLKYGMDWGLFHGVNTIKEARNRASTLVSDLKSSSLLLDGSSSECFDMHDVVGDVTISIASRDHHWLPLGRDDVPKKLSDEETRECKPISLHNAKVSEFPHHYRLE